MPDTLPPGAVAPNPVQPMADPDPIMEAADQINAQAAGIRQQAEQPMIMPADVNAGGGQPSDVPSSNGRATGSLPTNPAIRSGIEQIARQKGVPVNILMALAQQESGYNPNALGSQTPYGQAQGMMQYIPGTASNLGINPYDWRQAVSAAADQYKQRLAQGYSPMQAVMAHFGGDNQAQWGPKTQAYGRQVMARARDILGLYRQTQAADQAQAMPEPNAQPLPHPGQSDQPAAPSDSGSGSGSLLLDAGKMAAGGVVKGAGAIVRGAGQALDMVPEDPVSLVMNWITGTKPPKIPNPTGKVADAVQGFGQSIQDSISDASKQAMAGSTPTGDLDPRTWSLGSNPSLRGYMMMGSDLLGEMAPVIAGSIASGGSAAVGAALGVAQGGGQAVQGAHDAIMEMAKNGTLAQNSPYYAGLIKQGMSPDEAAQKTADAAGRWAFMLAAPVAAIGTAISTKLVHPATELAAGLNRAGRTAVRAGAGAADMAAQNAGQTAATNEGENIGAGTSVPVSQGVGGAAISGAIMGGLPAGAAGALSRRGGAADVPNPSAPSAGEAPNAGGEPAGGPQTPSGGGPDAQMPQQDATPAPQLRPTTAARGPLSGAINQAAQGANRASFEDALAQGQTPRVTVAGGLGAPISGTLERYQPNGRGGWLASIVDDDGEVHQFTDQDGVTIAPGGGPIEAAVAQAGPEAPRPQSNPAAITPEPEGDIAAQIAAVRDPTSSKRAALITPNTPRAHLNLSGLTNIRTKQGVFVTNDPELAAEAKANAWTMTNEQMQQLLGYTTPKALTDGTVVQAHDAAGNVVHQEATNQQQLPLAIQRANEMAPTGGHVTTTTAAAALGRRQGAMSDDTIASLTLPQAQARMDYLRDQARESGWNQMLRQARERVNERIVELGGQPESDDLPAASGLRVGNDLPAGGQTDAASGAADQGGGAPAAAAGADGSAPGSAGGPGAAGDGATVSDAAGSGEPDASVTGFKTAKGSTYQLHDDGTTTRDKAFRPEHGAAEQGPQPRSQATFYVTPDAADRLSEFQARGTGKRSIQQSTAGVYAGMRYEDGPHKGKFEKRTMVPIKTAPEVGLIPVETWQDGQRVHFGNPITEVSKGPKNGTDADGAAARGQHEPDDGAAAASAGRSTAAGTASDAGAERAASSARAGGEEPAPADASRPAEAERAAGGPEHAARPGAEEGAAEPPRAVAWFGSAEKADAYLDRKGLRGTHEVVPAGKRFEVRPKADAISQAAAEAATSPANERPEPTEAQKEAGNYAKGHVSIGGLDISIENPAGTRRRPEWEPLAHHYGYIRGSIGKDKDHVDVFLGPKAEDETNPVYVIDQKAPNGTLDEHKAMLGFGSPEEARAGYLANYEKGWDGFGGMRKMSFEQFKRWAKDPEQTKRPVSVEMTKAGKKVASPADVSTEKAQSATEEAAPSTGGGVVGRRADGVMIRQDENGVRYYHERGVRISEPVSLRPTAQGMRMERGELRPDFMTQAELVAAKRGSEVAPGGASPKAETAAAISAKEEPQEAPNAARGNEGDVGTGDQGAQAEPARAPEGDRAAGPDRQGPDGRNGAVGGDEQGGNARSVQPDGQPALRGRSGEAGGQDRDSGHADRPNRAGAGDRGNRRDAGAGPDGPEGNADRKPLGDYRYAPGELTRDRSWKGVAERNVDAIELVKKLEAEGRQATPEERATLARFTGWGASEIANGVFPQGRYEVFKPEWKELGERLRGLLTPEEYAAARRTTQYAHYTSEKVIRSIYGALGRMGFGGGRVLEPGMGIGLFKGLMPDGMAARSQYLGVEFDPLTAAIARHLYPESTIKHGDFTKTELPRDFFDAAVGNPPFGQIRITNDPEYRKQSFLLHDYFFAKTVDRVRPGGLLVFVTSKGTMDKSNSSARKYLADRANLLGAIRLPQTAFKDNAGTEVVTDVLFLQKRGPGIEPNGVEWSGLKSVKAGDGTADINEYFAEHPEMVLGEHALTGSMYRANDYTVTPFPGDIENHFAEAVARLPSDVYRAPLGSEAQRAQVIERDFNPTVQKEGSVYIGPEGALYQRRDGAGVPLTTRINADGKEIDLTPKQTAFLRDYAGLRDAIKQTQYDQLNDGDWQTSLKALNDAYDGFVAKHGNILAHSVSERENEDGTSTIITRWKNSAILNLDAENALVKALEKVNPDGSIEKSKLLTARVLDKPAPAEIRSVQDAMLVAMNQQGRLDIGEVARLAGVSPAEAISTLGDAIYREPAGQWVPADAYLSGNVVRKLAEAREAAHLDPKMKRNVAALEAVQPAPLAPHDITVQLGSQWVPPGDVQDFAKDVLGHDLGIGFNPILRQWTVDGNEVPGSEWGVAKMPPPQLLDAVLNSKTIKLIERVPDGKGGTTTVADAEMTEAANAIAGKMQAEFQRWIWADADRADRLARYYNEHFNNIVPRAFDGRHLTLPGISSRFELHDHQKRAIWRGIQDGNVYFAHAVGAGKTFAMIATAMEERRLGLSKKPMFTVPNHMLAQFAREFQELYPTAHIMVADDENFHTGVRRDFVARAALNDPDAIIITHSAFGRIGMSDEFNDRYVQDQIDRFKEMAEEAEGDRLTTKRLEASIERLERRLSSKQGKEKKDQVLNFEELGVDRLLVDEFHEYRKLDFATNRGSVKGIDPQGSQRATDLHMKVQYLEEKNPGRALVAASGTPVTNTMGELFTVQRFMQPRQLEEDGLDTFDAWASHFGQVVEALEPTPAGNYEPVTRFANFVNVPDLMRRVRSFMDILTSDQLGDLVQRPTVKGGGRQVIVTPVPDGYKAYQKELEGRIKAIRQRRGPPKPGDDIILKVIGDGRFSAIDMRFVDPDRPSDPNSKLNRIIDRLAQKYHDTADRQYHTDGEPDELPGSSLMAFTDIGLGEQSAASRGFDMRDWITRQLIAKGVKPNHIAFMRDYKQAAKKERLFADMRSGKVRLLIGGKDMETGVNAQKRLAYEAHLDAPWFPASVEQREGRIIRQGNQNAEVEIEAFATKGSYDSTMWGMNARKQRFITQAMQGDASVRKMEDVSEASSFEMAAALASGDERYLKLAGLRSDVDRLNRLWSAHERSQQDLRSNVRHEKGSVAYAQKQQREIQAALKQREPLGKGEDFTATVDGETTAGRDQFGEALFAAAKAMADDRVDGVHRIGSLGGFDLVYAGRRMGTGDYRASVELDMPGAESLISWPLDTDMAIKGIAARATNQIGNLDRELVRYQRMEEESAKRAEQLQKRVGAPFPERAELYEKQEALAELESELAAETAATDDAQRQEAVKEALDEGATVNPDEQTSSETSDGESAEGDGDAAASNEGVPFLALDHAAEPRDRVQTLTRLRGLWDKLAQGKISADDYIRETGLLTSELHRVRQDQRMDKALRDPERGPDWVRERLLRARRQGEIAPESADFALWLLNENPHLARDLAISVRKGEPGASGQYSAVDRTMALFKSRLHATDTAVHEIMHHTERMMPEEVQRGILNAYNKAFARALDAARKAIDPAKPETQARADALVDMRMASLGDGNAWKRVLESYARGVLNPEADYQFMNPSEFWAMNATKILSRRMETEGRWAATAKRWLSELVQKARAIFGLPSDAAVLRGLRSVINGRGTFDARKMLTWLHEDTPHARLFNLDGASADDAGKLRSMADALKSIQDGKDETVIRNLRPDLARFGGSPDVHITVGNLKSGLAHIQAKRTDAVLARVLAAVAIGRDVSFQAAKKTVRISHDGVTAVLSLDEHGKQKTWLLTGWEDGRPDAKGEVGAQSPATQSAPIFSRDALGASLRHIISAADTLDQEPRYSVSAAADGSMGGPASQRTVSDKTERTLRDALADPDETGGSAAGPTVDIGSIKATVKEALTSGPLGEAAATLLKSGAVRIEREAPRGAPVGADAWTDRNGTVHVLDSLPPAVAQAKLLHEMFHAGVRPLIGSDAWNGMQQQLGLLYRRARMGDTGLSRFYGEALDRLRSAAEQGDENAADTPLTPQEFAAYAIEQYERAPAGVRKWLDGAIGAVKAWALKRWGKQMGEITPAQLRQLAAGALEAGAATERALAYANMTDRNLYSASERDEALNNARSALQDGGAATLRDFVGNAQRDMGRFANYIAHPRHVAAIFRPFAPVFQAVMDRMSRRDRIINELNQNYESYGLLARDSKANVNKALELGRLLGATWTPEELQKGVTNPGWRWGVRKNELGERERYKRPVAGALTKAGETIKLSEGEARAYAGVRRMFDQALDMMRDQMLMDMGYEQYAGNMKALRDAVADIRDSGVLHSELERAGQLAADFEQAKRSGYVPFSRFGDYVVAVKRDRAPIEFTRDPRDEDMWVAKNLPPEMNDFMDQIGAHYDHLEGGWTLNDQQRQAVQEENTETLYAEKVESGLRDLGREELTRWRQKPVTEIPSVKAAYERIRDQWAKDDPSARVVAFQAKGRIPESKVKLSDIDALADVAQIDPAQWEQIRAKFQDAIQGMSFRKHFFNADNVPGYSQDFERAITDYMGGTAGYLARRQYQSVIDNALKGVTTPKLFQYANDYVRYTDQPAEEMRMLRQLGFFTYIAGNVKSGLVNLTQQALMSYPTLSQMANPLRVAKELARANVDAVRMMTAKQGYRLTLFDPAKAPADVREDLRQAWEAGDFIPSTTFDIMATANQRNIGTRQLRRNFEKAAQVIGLTFSVPERINRIATYIAAHRLAQDPALAERAKTVYGQNALAGLNFLGDNFSPSNFADYMVDETQFRMGKGNRPRVMRGPGTALLQFKGFMMQSIEAWSRMVMQQGKAGKLAAATSLATMVALSGFWGFPGADDMRKLLEGTLRFIYDRDIDVRTGLRRMIYQATGSQWLAAAADRGAPFAEGWDLGSVGMGNIAPESGSITDMMGIPWDMLISRPGAAAAQLRNGNPLGALMAVAPKFVGNIGQAWQMAHGGFRDSRGRIVLSSDDISQLDVIQKGIGFTPTDITNTRDARYAASRMQSATDQAKQQYIQRLATTLAAISRAKNDDTRADLRRQYMGTVKDIQDFNATVPPSERIVVSTATIRGALQQEMGGLPARFGHERRQARGEAAGIRELYGIKGVSP